MGPPPFGDGNEPGYSGRCGGCVLLQWGHRLSAMETGRSTQPTEAARILQWGHRLSAMETYADSASGNAR